MNLVKVDNMDLGPVQVEKVLEDKTLIAIILRYEGRTYRISKSEQYSVSVRIMEERDWVEVEKWVVEGTYQGIPVNMKFDDEYAAKDFLRELNHDHGLSAVQKTVRENA